MDFTSYTQFLDKKLHEITKMPLRASSSSRPHYMPELGGALAGGTSSALFLGVLILNRRGECGRTILGVSWVGGSP